MNGYKIHPGHGQCFIRGDSKTFRFLNKRCEKLFLAKKNPRKVDWTQVYRRMHKKGLVEESRKKRARKIVKAPRAIVGLSSEQLNAKRNQTDDARRAARDAALRELKNKRKAKAGNKKDKRARRQQQQGQKAAAAKPVSKGR